MKHLQEDEHIIMGEEPVSRNPVLKQIEPHDSRKEKIRFAKILAALLLFSVTITTLRGWGGSRFVNDFMAVLLMAFSAVSFWRIEEFAMIYRTFDVVAKQLRPWAYTVPFISAFLGLCYFISTDAWQINLLTMAFAAVGIYSYYQIRKDRAEVTSPTLGIGTRLSLVKVLLVLNLIVFVLSAIMLVA